ncbi:MAG: UDP-N-acetylmuramoyl-L-alanine--D-glutamate ligase [Spirochaetaceae bacterium]|jgi:UDP-N-acetylmuramoylalanine--D-glutamate ligase|nr:UDP-N-acetylmuramoyl-L-alanine--D-glutamate ligase [Spirochaetaceae bacterium]
MRVLVMGLGLHGGGVESARYLIRGGAEVTVTDLRDEKILAPSLEKLGDAGAVRYVLGRHRMEDFERADMVLKNPGVPPDSPFLRAARRIETDISLFLAASPARLTAVTGSKGKSSTASAIQWVLRECRNQGLLPGKSYFGGNITRSPLTFLESLGPQDDVVLELSSWQLGDLRGRIRSGRALLKPRCAVITSIMADHLNRYGTMENYVADKRIIYQGQDHGDATIAADDDWGRSFLGETPGRPLIYGENPLPAGVAGGWLSGPEGPGYALLPFGDRPVPGGDRIEVVPSRLLLPGRHQKKNLLAAALALLDLGLPPDLIRAALGTFPGIEHRLEFFYEKGGIRFYNDTAATIPEAAAAAVAAFESGLVLVTGGTDKDLDFTPLARAAVRVKALVLLAGSGSDKLRALFEAGGIPYRGPFDSVDAAVKAALEAASAGDTVVLSPGCASFGMFKNEFDRGQQWKEAVIRLAASQSPA